MVIFHSYVSLPEGNIGYHFRIPVGSIHSGGCLAKLAIKRERASKQQTNVATQLGNVGNLDIMR